MAVSGDWWAGDRATAPARITIISREQRQLTIGLSPAVAVDETVDGNSLEATVVRWRDTLTIDPSPVVLPIAYDGGTNVAGVTINGSALPRTEPCALILTFDVTTAAGVEQRAVYVALDVVI